MPSVYAYARTIVYLGSMYRLVTIIAEMDPNTFILIIYLIKMTNDGTCIHVCSACRLRSASGN